MLKVGLTGGIGVGKTVVGRMFSLLGVPVYDSDARAKWVMRHDETLRLELVDAYGLKTFTEEGDLNRDYLAPLVFGNPVLLEQLNSLVHPHVRNDFTKWLDLQAKAPYVLKEAALMYESEAWKQMDQIITVHAPMDVRMKRLLQRDTHRTEADIKAIMGKQLNEDERMSRADHIIYNDGQQAVIPQVLQLHQLFLSPSA
ncbi:dephospho-CoA kinase [Pontibacter sp. E15-1]|uniref:dephospho-CoA kinase n=1 Tax=Pontibacter sp. E15-1 TaxID=2919918 RepID=UPI001F4FD250|nr:dephospho-CoA kinase [Pontibacter sp. E15-1]MCJ8166848.1 dephospho-CoA kinase [Pontibacter sp. E15-1]